MKSIIILATSLLSLAVFGQDPSFSMGSENQTYLNPAFTGTAKNMRGGLSYRNQWPGISGSYITTNVYFDKNLNKYGSAGIVYSHDEAGGAIKSDNVYLDYAYQLKVKEKGVLSFGVEVGYIHKSLDWDKLTFGSMIDERKGFVYQTGEVPRRGSVSNLDLGAGILYYNDLFFASIAAHHLNQPHLSFYASDSRLPILVNFYGGAKIGLGEELALIPQLDFKFQDNFENLAGVIVAQYKKIQLGSGFRNGDAYLFRGGVAFDHFRLMYNYDFTYSELNKAVNGSHELGLQFYIDGKKHNERPFELY